MSLKEPIIPSDAFTEIFYSMSEGLVMVDGTGKIIVSNPAAEQIFGYPKNGLVGLSLELLLPEKYKDTHVRFRKDFNSSPSPRKMGTGRDLWARRKDGTEFPVEISLSYTKYKDQLLVMAFVSDITLRKKAQEELRRSEEQLIMYAAELENKVHLRTEALNNLVKELEREIQERKRAEEETIKALARERELSDLKSKFVSIASHEFRTPLSSILSSSALIGQYVERGEAVKIPKHVGRIKASVEHLTTMLNDLLSLGKLEEGKIEVRKAMFDCGPFIAEVEEEINAILKPGQNIVVDVPEPMATLFTDPGILRGIFFNLLSNASKYSDPGKSIFIGCVVTKTEFTLTVTDEGVGIPENEIKHVFERFFRATNVTNIQGTGLGLNIVRRYVDLLGGRVTFHSIYGKGTTFTIVMPNQ